MIRNSRGAEKMLMAILLASALQQTTTCTTNLGITTCQTDKQIVQTSPVPGYQPIPDRAPAYPTGQTPREIAYDKVGDLVSANRCDDAKRLAQFYGFKDIVKDTARACP